ncbi:hypothetical protein B0H13DRAFT_2359233 [Mycena leptocephala]|nr:hypothetical protein B0H13DRAFT_2359233 [Mycena leptocephala]
MVETVPLSFASVSTSIPGVDATSRRLGVTSPSSITSLRIVPPAPSSTSAQFFSAFISLASSRSCIIHRRMGAVPPNSCSFPCANLWLADTRIPASFRHADAQTTLNSGLLCVLVFWGSPRSFRLRALTPLFAFAGVCDGGRPPPAAAPPSLPRLPHLRISRRSGETEMGTQMEMEWARVDRDGVQVRVCMYPSLTLRRILWFGILSFCPPAFAFARSRPRSRLRPHPRPHLLLVPALAFPSPPLCDTARTGSKLHQCAYALAPSRRWRSAGAVRAPPSLTFLLVRSRRSAYALRKGL